MFNIFSLSLSDGYIKNLNLEDTHELIKEAERYMVEQEREIALLIWKDERPQTLLKPSQISWDPDLYGEEIDADPSFRTRLNEAQEIAAMTGIARAIQSTALIHLSHLEEGQ